MEHEPLHAWFVAIQQAVHDLHATVSVTPENFFAYPWRNHGYFHIRINTPVGLDPFQLDLQGGFNYIDELARRASIIPPAVSGYIITILVNTDPVKDPQAPTLALVYQDLREFRRLVARPNTSAYSQYPSNVSYDYVITEYTSPSAGPYVHRPFSTILDMGRPSISDDRLHLAMFKNSTIRAFRVNNMGISLGGHTFTSTPLTMTDIQKQFLYTPVVIVADEQCAPDSTLLDLASYDNIWMMILVLFADHAQRTLKRDFKGIEYTLANAFPLHGNPFKLFAEFLTQSNTSIDEFISLWRDATRNWYIGQNPRRVKYLLGGVIDNYMNRLHCVSIPRHVESTSVYPNTAHRFPYMLRQYVENPTTALHVLPRLYSSRVPPPHQEPFFLSNLRRYFRVDGFAYIPRATRKVGE
jgi:hypothetical protein